MDIIEAGQPPRAVFTDYPLGHSVGRPFDPDNQRAIIRDGLAALESINEPGTIVHLPYRWSDSDQWKTQEKHGKASDTRSPRGDIPQYQTQADRIAAEGT